MIVLASKTVVDDSSGSSQPTKAFVPDPNPDWPYPGNSLLGYTSDDFVYAMPSDDFRLNFSANQSTDRVYAASGNIDQDADLELVVASDGEIRMYDVDGNQVHPSISVPTSNGTNFILEDVDGDGIREIVTGTRSNGNLQIHIHKYDESLVAKLTRNGGYDAHMWPIAYLEDDRLLVGYGSGYSKEPRGYGVWHIGTQQELWYYDVGPCVYGSFSVADADADGDMDVVAGTHTCHNGATGSGVNGSGTRTTDGDLYTILVDETGNEQLLQLLGANTNGGANGLGQHMFADFTQDGVCSIVALVSHDDTYYPGDSQLQILNLDGSVQYQVSVGTNGDPRFLVADLNTDGVQETLLWSRENANTTVYDADLNVVVSRSGLGDTSIFQVRATADMDGDRAKEILASDGSVLKVYSSGDLSEQWRYDFDDNIRSILTTDLNADTGVEIIVITVDGTVHLFSASTSDNPPLPQPPGKPNAVTVDHNSISVSWSSVDGATSYELYRSANNSTSDAKLAYSGSSTSDIVDDLNPSTRYYFWVKACNETGCSDDSAYDDTMTESAPPAIPSPPAIDVDNVTGGLRATWNRITDATYYDIYRSTSSSSVGSKIDSIESSNYVIEYTDQQLEQQ